jgi:GAF domain-containing protein
MLPRQIKLKRLDAGLKAQTVARLAPAGLVAVIIDARASLARLDTYRPVLGPAIPILALINARQQTERVLAGGVTDYLHWPLSLPELRLRLENYLSPTFSGLSILVQGLHQTHSRPVSPAMDNSLQQFAAMFSASAAWLMLADPQKAGFNLAGQYGLPPMFAHNHSLLQEETGVCKTRLEQPGHPLPQVSLCPYLSHAQVTEAGGLTHHLTVPLPGVDGLAGMLQLAFEVEPEYSIAQLNGFAQLGQHLGKLLQGFNIQEDVQRNATQNAFMILLARMLSENQSLNTILSLTLELTTPTLNATGSAIWLWAGSDQPLTLAASLSDGSGPPPSQIPYGQGLMGWVAEHQQTLLIDLPTTDPRHSPALDYPPGSTPHHLLATSLRHHQTTLGVMALYSHHPTSFDQQDTILLEGIAALSASAIVGAQLLQELRDYAEQQRVLYKMSQQIASGLELPGTLDRALIWLQTLLSAKVGLLWLLEDDKLKLVTANGLQLPPPLETVLPVNLEIIGRVITAGETMIFNDPYNDPTFDARACQELGIVVSNIMVTPIVSQGCIIGAVCLINKKDGPIQQYHKTLVLMAADMIAIAIGNAQLHTKTIALMKEREQIQQHALQTERLVTMGRLTASLSHEINNPMQAVLGALVLSLEELDIPPPDPETLKIYLQLCLKEAERVVQLINRMRQIYRPTDEPPASIDLGYLLQEAANIAHKELKRRSVRLQVKLPPELPPIYGSLNQLHLVILSFILNLGDGIKPGGELQLTAHQQADKVKIEFITQPSQVDLNRWNLALSGHTPVTSTESSVGLSLSFDVIKAHQGEVYCRQTAQKVVCTLQFPIESTG